ncbi:MAG: polymer-forming cytoskeletal protein [Deltaproteobacteria bacterium]|nr:polymer-forming cytoskeletal protein [Deltaproteobacteria bacterium]
MKLNKNKKGKDLSLDTLIGPNTLFEGSIQSDRSVCVEGSIRGRIEAKGEVVVGREGKVEADIYADSIVVGGQVIGNINARSRLEITATGRVTGDVEATTITVAEGGMVDGSFKMMEATGTAYPQLESGLSRKESDQANIQSPSDPIESLPQA